MLHPSTKKLIDKLAEMTRKRRIGWAETEDGRLAYQTEGYSVILTGDPQSVNLLSRDGKPLEEVTAEEIAESQTDEGVPYNTAFSEMFREAARQARGTETAIDTVLAGLDLDGDGIPDVPAPETDAEPGETIPEDTVDESWQGSDTTVSPATFDPTPVDTTPYPEPSTAPPAQTQQPEPAGWPGTAPVMTGNTGFGNYGAPERAPYAEPVEPAPAQPADPWAETSPQEARQDVHEETAEQAPIYPHTSPDHTPAGSDQSVAPQTSSDPYGVDSHGSATGQQAPEPAPDASYQTPSASRMWGQPAAPAQTTGYETPTQHVPAGDNQAYPDYQAEPDTQQVTNPIAEASEAAQELTGGSSDRVEGFLRSTDSAARAASDTTQAAAIEETVPPEAPAPGFSGTEPQIPDTPQAAPFGTPGFGQPAQPDTGPAYDSRPQPSPAPTAWQPDPQPAAEAPPAQPASQPLDAPAGNNTPSWTSPAPRAPNQPAPAQPFPPHGQAPQTGSDPAGRQPDPAQTAGDEDEEGPPPPKPITRFNPWN